MGAELVTTVRLHCDAPVDWTITGQCSARFDGGGYFQDTPSTLEILARRARASCWVVEIIDEGLKGTSAKVTCPDHARESS